MLDYPSLAAMAAVVREGSFERAASVLGITPSAVSQRVKGLEERLGAILIVRGQPCRPTPIGARLYAHVEQVRLLEGDVVAALPKLADQRSEGTPTLRIAVNSDSLTSWFPAAAAAFSADTGAMLDLVLDDEEHTADWLRTGEVQAAVTADPAPVTGCRTAALGAMTYLATASPDFAKRHFADGVDGRTLARAPMLRFDRRDHLQARWMREAHGADAGPPTHWVPSTRGMLDMALQGLGWSMTPLLLAAPYLAEGRLIELPPVHRIEVNLYWQYNRLGIALLEQLTKAVRGQASSVLCRAKALAPPGRGFG